MHKYQPSFPNDPHFFFFNDTATTEIYTLSLHDALPIYARRPHLPDRHRVRRFHPSVLPRAEDRKSTRLNSSHDQISYAVFCLKKNNQHVARHRPASHPREPAPPALAQPHRSAATTHSIQ